MKKPPLSWIRPAVKALDAYHLEERHAVLKLDQNENNLGVPDSMREELIEALRQAPLHRYPPSSQSGILGTLSEMSGWPREGILVGNGSDDLLHGLAASFLEPGRTSVCPTPSFFVYAYTTRLAGAEAVEVPLTSDMQYDVDALVQAIERHEPAVVYLCSPNNPTGSVLEPRDIVRVAEAAPGVVVLDEAYWEFSRGSALPLLSTHANLILFRTFSKALALAGLRLGYLMTTPELAAQMRKAQPPYPVNRFSIEAARVAAAHVAVLRERAREIASERDRLYQQMLATPGVEVFPSQGNFLLFRTSLGARETFEALLAHGVLVRDVSSHPLLPQMLRVAVGAPGENEAFYRALSVALEAAREPRMR